MIYQRRATFKSDSELELPGSQLRVSSIEGVIGSQAPSWVDALTSIPFS